MMITWRKSLSKHFRRVCKRKVQSINGVREENEKFQMLESWVLIGKLGVIFYHMYVDYTNASRTERKNPNMENMREISWTTWEYCGRKEKKKIKNKRFRNIHQRTKNVRLLLMKHGTEASCFTNVMLHKFVNMEQECVYAMRSKRKVSFLFMVVFTEAYTCTFLYHDREEKCDCECAGKKLFLHVDPRRSHTF